MRQTKTRRKIQALLEKKGGLAKSRFNNFEKKASMSMSFNYPNFATDYSMATTVKYIIGSKGEKESVLVPIKTWNKLNENIIKLQRKIEALQDSQPKFRKEKSVLRIEKKSINKLPSITDIQVEIDKVRKQRYAESRKKNSR
jgi:hypothetical protein